MKKLYICGDSFGVPDPEYGACWVDYLQHKSTTHSIVNLSQVCASNLMISQQVDLAMAHADAIVVLCTASTRSQTRLNDRVVPYSIHSLDSTTPFDSRQLAVLAAHTREFFDLDLAIYENQCIIESMLQRLTDSKIPFIWDQGGFEHASYGGTREYFSKWNWRRSSFNLWDHAQSRDHRPYYHIINDQVHQAVADYYESWLYEQA
jgi:hypothetical protein